MVTVEECNSIKQENDKLNIPSFLFLSELKIYHLSFLTITHDAFDIADPSSMQDACHNELSKYDLTRHESPSSSVVRAPVREVMGSIPVGDSDFFFVPRSWQTEYSIFLKKII